MKTKVKKRKEDPGKAKEQVKEEGVSSVFSSKLIH